uniref:RanBP2-type domain-containing protein n=1 Tax=Aureoumbra lagunensis TaxID=44058 RepID=A0A7S3NKM9_9STRA|mmetsp:Transcript_20731/g.26830  ORF Transcript_20731/g.26830 Transcript_20731/m.26830 type:complete len:436 (+) Transcript_20731:100-1407(+)
MNGEAHSSQKEENVMDDWSCVACTLKNRGSSNTCECCSTSRTHDKNSWLCVHCTYLNTSSVLMCDMCKYARELPRIQSKSQIKYQDEKKVTKRQKLRWPPGNMYRPEAWRELPICQIGDVHTCKQLLAEHGVVIFRNVLNADEIQVARDLFWQWFETHTPARRTKPSTLTSAVAQSCGHANTGVTTNFCIGQSEFLWYCRLKAVPAWRTVWDCEDLVSSFDGCGLWRNPYLFSDAFTHGRWYHLDQNVRENAHFLGYQGLVQISDTATDETGSLVVIPGSHKDFRANCERGNKLLNRGSFVRLSTPADLAYCDQHAVQCAPLYPGDIVVWDSRVVHCSASVCRNLPSTHSLRGGRTFFSSKFSDNEISPPMLARLVAYVAMMPRSHVSSRVATNRRNAVLQGYGSGWNSLIVRRSPAPPKNFSPPHFDHPLWSLV